MMKMDVGEPTYFEWITKNITKGSKIGCDPGLIPTSKYFSFNLNY